MECEAEFVIVMPSTFVLNAPIKFQKKVTVLLSYHKKGPNLFTFNVNRSMSPSVHWWIFLTRMGKLVTRNGSMAINVNIFTVIIIFVVIQSSIKNGISRNVVSLVCMNRKLKA